MPIKRALFECGNPHASCDEPLDERLAQPAHWRQRAVGARAAAGASILEHGERGGDGGCGSPSVCLADLDTHTANTTVAALALKERGDVRPLNVALSGPGVVPAHVHDSLSSARSHPTRQQLAEGAGEHREQAHARESKLTAERHAARKDGVLRVLDASPRIALLQLTMGASGCCIRLAFAPVGAPGSAH